MEVTIDNIQYELDSLNNTASVIQSEYAGDVVIPAQIHVDGSIYIVNSIENDAFNDCSAVTSIVIPNTVTFIGKFAFYGCSSLTSITIPNSITKIGGYAFMGCSSLSAITIPSSVTFIGPCAFDSSYLTSIEVETNNTTYDSRNNCNAIIETATNTLIIGCQCTIIPNNITSIGNNAFDGCSSLNRIIIPHSVKKIGEYAFSNCPSLASIKVETGNTIYDSRKDCNAIIETATNTLVVACKNTFIPDNVVSIGDYAFDGCNSLSFITIPDSVKRIGNRAFYKCSSLISITIPNSIISIGGGAFEDSGIYNDDSKWEEGVLYISNCLIAANENLCSIYTIQDNTRLIGDYAFRYCESLKKIIIPTSVTSIGKYAFTACSSLASIIIPDSVTNIDEGAFHECSSLYSIILPNGIKSIKCSTFSGCFDLTSIILPNSISRIEDYAFYDCSSLTSITIPSGVTHIDKHAFGSCSFLTSVVIPDSVINIGEGAFEGCIFLKSIIIPNGLRTIGSKAFSECTSLTSIFMPNSIIYIGEKAFSKCSKLSSVTIPTSVTNLEKNVFYGCTSLNSITVEPGNTIYDSREDCNAIIETATNTLITGCQNTTIPNSVTTIEDYAFSDCTSLTSITIPNSVTSIGINAFRVCSSFTTITIPNSVTSIGNRAFDGCSSLNTIYVEATTPSTLGYNVFTNTPSPACYIPCGTLTAYEASDWAEQVGGFVEQCDNNNDEQSSVSVTDGTAADWNNLPVEYLFETQCAEGSSWNALKSVKVYADSTYINLVVEWDTEIVTDLSSVPFQVYLNVDNDAPTGGFSDLWIKPNIDLLLEGNFYLDGFPCAYQPVVALYAGTPLANEWAWDLISIESVAANQLITKGVMEIQIDYGKLPVKLENTFTVGFSIQQSWTPVGVLPNAANDNTGNRVLAEKMLVRINNVNVSTPVENTELNSSNVQKIFRDGQVLILRDGKIYSVMGQEL